MKRLIVILFVLVSLGLQAQNTFGLGIKAGLSTPDVDPEAFFITSQNDIDEFRVDVEDAKYGIHIGAFINIPLGQTMYLRPEVLFNSNTVEYQIDDLTLGNTFTTFREDTYRHLDLPLLIGADLGFVRLTGGPVGHVFLGSDFNLKDVDGLQEKWDEMTWGYQAGLGIDLGSFLIDLRYEGNFRNYGEHIKIGNQQFDFSDSDNRILLSLGFKI